MPAMPTVKAIIFDMDGLMIDSERLYSQAQHQLAAMFNKTMPKGIRKILMGRKPIESITIFKEKLDIPLEPEKILDIRNSIMREKLQNDLLPMPGLFHIIDSFYGKLKLAVSTGAQKEFLDLVVDKLDIRGKFAVLQDSDGIHKGKPEPEIFSTTCVKLGLNPAHCIVLEDSANGVLAGKAAGCYVIAVPSQYTKDHDFSSADFTAEDLFAAERHISGLCSGTTG